MTAKKTHPKMRGPMLPVRERLALDFARQLVRGGATVGVAVKTAWYRFFPNPSTVPGGKSDDYHINRLRKAYLAHEKNAGRYYAVRGYWRLDPKWLDEPADDDVKN